MKPPIKTAGAKSYCDERKRSVPNQSTPEIEPSCVCDGSCGGCLAVPPDLAPLKIEQQIREEIEAASHDQDNSGEDVLVPLVARLIFQAVLSTEARVREETAREIVEALREPGRDMRAHVGGAAMNATRTSKGTNEIGRIACRVAADFIERTFLNGEGSDA